MQPIIPTADTIPAAWGWFQFLLLLTFPLHLLAMNAMVGGLTIGIVQHFRGGEIRTSLAHRIAVVGRACPADIVQDTLCRLL
jgi:hypothetical protein